MTFMKFKTENGIHIATNCPVELDIVEVINAKPGCAPWTTYAVSTARTHNQFDTWSDAVRFAEYKFGVIFETEETV